MSEPKRPAYQVTRESEKELERDRRVEARMLWKGVFLVLVIVLIVWLRQTYWL